MTYRIVMNVLGTDPILEEGEARDPVRDARRLLDAFLTKQALPAGGLSTPTPPVFSRLAIEFLAPHGEAVQEPE